MSEKKKVLVTGGAGFIASHIVDRFCELGAEVVIIDDLSTGVKNFIPEGVPLHEVGVESEEAKDIVQEIKPDLIIHAAAQISVRISMDDPLKDADINVKGILNLLEGLSNAPHVIFLSTGGAMYGASSVIPTDETVTPIPSSFYGLHKRFGELYLDFWQRERGLRCTALRLANVYGPRQNPHGEAGVVAIFSERLLSGQECIIFGDGGQTRDFVYVEDVVNAVVSACEDGVTGVYNIGTGVETSVQQLFDTMQQIVVDQYSKEKVALRYEAHRPGEQERSAIDPAAMQKASSWQPHVSIGDGLAQTIDWFNLRAESEAS